MPWIDLAKQITVPLAVRQAEDKNLAYDMRKRGAVPVCDLVSGILDPALRRKAGISVELVQGWDEIVGEKLGLSTRPEKISWPPRGMDQENFRPGTLLLACDQSAALHVQHQTGEIILRVNAFFGYAAIDRIRIVQKPVARKPARPSRKRPALSPEARDRISAMTGAIEDDDLRKALEKLGESIVGERSP